MSQPKVQSSQFAIVFLLAAIVSIQLGASLSKQLFPLVGPIGATILRLIFAAMILVVVYRPFRLKLTRSDRMIVAAYGTSLGLMNVLFYLAIERIPLGIAVALEFIGPLSVALFNSKRRLDFLWALLAALGIYLIVPEMSSVSGVDSVGVVLALGAGACWAAYIVFGKKTASRIPSGQAVAIGMTVAALVVLPVALVSSGAHLLAYEAYPLAMSVAILSSALPYSLEMKALKKMPLKTFGILMSLEPVVATLFGIIILGEVLSIAQWIAIACIVVASAGSELGRSEKSQGI